MPDMIQLLDVVALLKPMPNHRLHRGQIGAVVEELSSDAFEVEFADNHGRTFASLAVNAADLMVLHDEPTKTS